MSVQTADALARLRLAPPPEYAVIGTRRRDTREVSLSEDDQFIIFPTIHEPTRLKAPIDWNQDPFQSRSWRAQLHTLRFLDVLLSRYRNEQDTRALRSACDIVLDWISSNPPVDSQVNDMSWSDKVAGDRAPFIGYLMRAAVLEKLVTEDEAQTLLDSALDHIEFLMDDTQYVRTSNHGLYQDVGLVLLSIYLDFLPAAKAWKIKGLERFSETLSLHIAGDEEGIYLEHSPFYQWLIVGLIRRFQALAQIDDERLHSHLEALENASAWLVLPNGQTPPLGDSDMLPAPSWCQQISQRAQGLRFFHRAGIACVRTKTSMLVASAGYHTHAHKHADELSFCLFERNKLILAEAGKYGYDDADPARRYAISSSAHNVLIVDDEPFAVQNCAPYGGALTRSGAGNGWFAIEGKNPLLQRQGVRHHRLFVYRPDSVLVIVDRLESSARHCYMRLFHFGTDVAVTSLDSRSIEFNAGEIDGILSDHSSCKVETSVRIGQMEPELAGWSFPTYRDWQPIPTVSMRSEGQDTMLVATVSLNQKARSFAVLEINKDGAVVIGSTDNGIDARAVRIKPLGTDLLDVSTE